MDELGRKRRERDEKSRTPRDQPAAGGADDLAERDEAAAADDREAADRDLDAGADDAEAGARDRAAEERDAEADSRDGASRIADSVPALFADRRRARSDRADAADDRARAADDRDRARGDRMTSRRHRERASDDRGAAHTAVDHLHELLDRAEDNAEDMLVIGQAQGRLMAERDLDALEALVELCLRAARDDTELGVAARDSVSDD